MGDKQTVKVGDKVKCLVTMHDVVSGKDYKVIAVRPRDSGVWVIDDVGEEYPLNPNEYKGVVTKTAGMTKEEIGRAREMPGIKSNSTMLPAFKVGGRVRLIKDGLSTTGAVGKLATIKSWSSGNVMDRGQYLLDIDGPVDYKTPSVTPQHTRAGPECFELLPPSFTLEAGKYYRTRDGRKVGPMVNFGWKDGYPWSTYSTKDTYYSDSGQAQGSGDVNNLVAEWSDEPKHDPADKPADEKSPGEASVHTDKIVKIVFDADTSKMEAKLDRVIEKLERINALREVAA